MPIYQCIYSITVDSLYLEHPLSRTSLYLELKSQSLCVSCNLFFSLYFELSLSRTNFLVPCEFEIERVNCTLMKFWFLKYRFPVGLYFYTSKVLRSIGINLYKWMNRKLSCLSAFLNNKALKNTSRSKIFMVLASPCFRKELEISESNPGEGLLISQNLEPEF